MVAFLDAPSLDTAELSRAIADAFERLAADAVLSVFGPSEDSAAVCLTASDEIEVLHTVAHPTGTTFVLRRAR